MWVLSRRKALLQYLGLDRSRLWVSMMFNLIFTITILQLIGRNQSKIDCKICVEKNIKFFFWNVGNWFLFTCAKDVTQHFSTTAHIILRHIFQRAPAPFPPSWKEIGTVHTRENSRSTPRMWRDTLFTCRQRCYLWILNVTSTRAENTY